MGWHGTGGGTGCAAWLQAGGTVLTAVWPSLAATSGCASPRSTDFWSRLATLTTARARHSGGDGSASRAIPHGMGVNKLYDDPRGQRGWCTLAVCMVGSRLLAQGRRAAACTGSSWRREKLPAPAAREVQTALKAGDMAWYGRWYGLCRVASGGGHGAHRGGCHGRREQWRGRGGRLRPIACYAAAS